MNLADLEARLAAMTDDERLRWAAIMSCGIDRPTEADIKRQMSRLSGVPYEPRLAPARDYEPIGSLRAYNWGE